MTPDQFKEQLQQLLSQAQHQVAELPPLQTKLQTAQESWIFKILRKLFPKSESHFLTKSSSLIPTLIHSLEYIFYSLTILFAIFLIYYLIKKIFISSKQIITKSENKEIKPEELFLKIQDALSRQSFAEACRLRWKLFLFRHHYHFDASPLHFFLKNFLSKDLLDQSNRKMFYPKGLNQNSYQEFDSELALLETSKLD